MSPRPRTHLVDSIAELAHTYPPSPVEVALARVTVADRATSPADAAALDWRPDRSLSHRAGAPPVGGDGLTPAQRRSRAEAARRRRAAARAAGAAVTTYPDNPTTGGLL